MKHKIFTPLFTLLFLLGLVNFAASQQAVSTEKPEKKRINLKQRTGYLLSQCDILLKKAGWNTMIDNDQVKAFRLGSRYDEIILVIEADYYTGYYFFTVSINKNDKQTSHVFNLREEIVNDDNKLRDITLSAVVPAAVLREGIGDFRKAYTSIFSFGYSRTSDDRNFYPAYGKGNIHLAWQLVYDPSARILLPETSLSLGDYLSFSAYLDSADEIHENFFNIDFLIFGKSKYTGAADHGTRFIYGFFNGLEYFRPGFSDSTVKWDHEIYHTRPYIQYAIWRALQWNMMFSRIDGSRILSAELMFGAGMGVGPSSLFYSGLTEEEEKNMSHAFRSIKYRKQNYYFSYTVPVRISLCADHVKDFRFEVGYNYYFFYPVLTDNLYDMLNIIKGSIGYYLSYDVLLSLQYEHWMIKSMLHNQHMYRHWNRLIIEFKNYF